MTNQLRNSLFASTSAFAQIPEPRMPVDANDAIKIEQKVALAQLDVDDLHYKLTEAISRIKDQRALELVTDVANELYRSLR